MADVEFKESTYRFTEPVRYYKANDPYYWEVDNIPLKQLQENCLWLKDQLGTLQQSDKYNSDIKRSDFFELKPHTDGATRTIKVNPGRFSARINDAYNITALEILNKVLGQELGELDAYTTPTANAGNFIDINGQNANDTLVNVLNTFQLKQVEDSLNMNGLAERAFTYPTRSEDQAGSQYLTNSTPTIGTSSWVTGFDQPAFPITDVLLWAKDSALFEDFYLLKTFDYVNPNIGYAGLPKLENHLIKKWRGVARISIVDIPEELEISIPAFDPEDFYYVDESGTKQILDAQTRIDLLFIYSKPVDTNSTTIAKFTRSVATGGSPQGITKAELGLVKGAGIGIDFQGTANIKANYKPQLGFDTDGNLLMLPHVSDQATNATNTNGFTSLDVHGSFPAPDDLLNLAPMLSDSLAGNEYELLGQSILPIAYVISNKTGTAVNGILPIATNDIIDIRPFFRTAELTYNERSGLAAAVPQLSLANPAVGKASMNRELKRVYENLNLPWVNEETTSQPRLVGAGYVFGGSRFGPEATMLDYYSTTQGYDSTTGENAIKSKYGFPTTFSFPILPDWDVADWTQKGTVTGGSIGINAADYINQALLGQGDSHDVANGEEIPEPTTVPFGSKYDGVDLTKKLSTVGNEESMRFFVVKKRVYINKGLTPWVSDYHVDVQLWNCTPLSDLSEYGQPQGFLGSDYRLEESVNKRPRGAISHVWVEKANEYFTIYVAFPGHADQLIADTQGNTGAGSISNERIKPYGNFVVLTEDMLVSQDSQMNSIGFGACSLPTIQFKITGYPKDYSGVYLNLNGTNPSVSLA
jgi:hypothetical protein